MKPPFILINGRLAERKQFVLTDGEQPAESLFYLTKGSFRLTMEGKTEILKEGDTIIFPDSTKYSRCVEQKIEFVFLEFKLNTDNPLAFKLPHGKIEWKNRKRFLSNINTYIELIPLNTPVAVYMKEHLLNDILLQAIYENSNIGLTSEYATMNHPRVKAASEYIRENLNKKISVQDVAQAALTNPTTLSYTFTKVLGISVGEYIVQMRMTEGARLLQCTNYKIKEVAAKCGYESEFYFSSAFKRFHGMSPSQYKKKYSFLTQ